MKKPPEKNTKKPDLFGSNTLGGGKNPAGGAANPFAGNTGAGKKHSENPFAPAASIKAPKPGGGGKASRNAAQQVRQRKTGP